MICYLSTTVTRWGVSAPEISKSHMPKSVLGAEVLECNGNQVENIAVPHSGFVTEQRLEGESGKRAKKRLAGRYRSLFSFPLSLVYLFLLLSL